MKNIVLLFPGQGSQYIGMGKGLYERFADAKQVFEEASEALGYDLKKLCFEGSMEELTKTENTQPAILTVSMAAFRAYMQETGMEPRYCAGHSLGEISALAYAGGIEFSDAVKIVRQRGKFMQEAVEPGSGAMAAVSGIAAEVVKEECGSFNKDGSVVVVSNYNSPEQTVISGHRNAVESAMRKLEAQGTRVVPLKVSAPFHSPLMQGASERLRGEMMQYSFGELKYPVVSNVNAMPYSGKDSIIDNLCLQIVRPVLWQASMEYLAAQGAEIAVEVGPGTVLRNLARKNVPGIMAFSYDKEDDIQALKGTLSQKGQQAGNKAPSVTVVTRCLAIAVCTKNSNWDNEEYHKGVVEPYRKIQQLQDTLEKEGKSPDRAQMEEALEMLRSVFITKKTPVEEQIERFNQIFDETGTRQLFPDFKMPSAG